MPGGMGGRGGMGGGMPPGGMGGATPGGRPGRPPGGARPDFGSMVAEDPELAAFARPPMTLVVEQSDVVVVLRERGETLKTLRLAEAGGATVLEGDELAARWKGRRLVAKGSGPRHGELEETYELQKGGKVLKITTRIENAERLPSLSIERVYRRVEGN
jgi:hypothetical protein